MRLFTPCDAVLVDVERDTFNVNPEEVRRKISRLKPKQSCQSILPVVLATWVPCSRSHANRNLRIIEDCAHAIETEYCGQKAGAIGDCGVLSFYSTKNIVTGEGGMLLTNDEEVAACVKILALRYVAGCL